MAQVQIAALAHGRSGDKGDICNVGLVANDESSWEVLCAQVTAARVKEHFADLVRGEVVRYELPNIRALNFVCQGALNGGSTLSLRSDHLGKVMYAWLLRMEVETGEHF